MLGLFLSERQFIMAVSERTPFVRPRSPSMAQVAMNTAMTVIIDMIFVRLNTIDLLRYSSFPTIETLNTSMVSGSRIGTNSSSSC